MKKNNVFVVFTLLVSSVLFSQTTYHVATNGSNSNPGTLAQPFKTLQKAANVVSAGDTVLVHTGVYRNSDFDTSKTAPSVAYATTTTNSKIWGGNDLLKIQNKDGNTTLGYITFKPYQNDVVTLEFDNNYGVLIKNCSYINFEGFIVKGIADKINQDEAEAAWGKYKLNGTVHDLATELSIDLNNPPAIGTDVTKTKQTGAEKPSYYNGRGIVVNNSQHVNILNNTIQDVTSAAIRVQKSDWTTVEGNEVKNCTYWTTAGVGAITVAEAKDFDNSTAIKIKLLRNYVHHNENRLVSWNPNKTKIHWAIDEGTGLFLTRNVASNGSGSTGGGTDYDSGKMLIANNISAFNGASGIVCHFTNRVIIEHNTCYKNGTTNQKASGPEPGGIGVNASNNVDIRNNIIYATPDSWAIGKLGGSLSNINRNNNIVWNENGVTIHRQMSTGWTKENPALTDPENGDFTITSSSPAVNGGVTTITVTDDYLGNPRNDGTPDVGAYEYSAPLSIKNNTIVNISVFPNPTYNYVLVTGDLQKVNFVSVYNVVGKLIFSQKVNSSQKLKIDLSHLKNGLYFIKTNTFVKSVIKK